jgi:hypothetical protein
MVTLLKYVYEEFAASENQSFVRNGKRLCPVAVKVNSSLYERKVLLVLLNHPRIESETNRMSRPQLRDCRRSYFAVQVVIRQLCSEESK